MPPLETHGKATRPQIHLLNECCQHAHNEGVNGTLVGKLLHEPAVNQGGAVAGRARLRTRRDCRPSNVSREQPSI